MIQEEKEQSILEEKIKEEIERRCTLAGEHIYNKLQPQFMTCSAKEERLTLRYQVQDWELNHMDTMHGGLIATAIDTTCGMLALCLSGAVQIPTINLSIQYLSPVRKDDSLLVTSNIQRLGNHLINVSAVCYSENTGKIAATAMAAFMKTG